MSSLRLTISMRNDGIFVGWRAAYYDLSIRLSHRAAFREIERVAFGRHLVAVDLVAQKQSAIVAAQIPRCPRR